MVVLGVARSGTRLLKTMLDAHPQLALPGESYFLAALWARHGARVRTARFLDDFRRIELSRPRSAWSEADLEAVAGLAARMDFAEAVDALYGRHAAANGASRYGNKSPEYTHHLRLLERSFPDAHYVHIVRDARNAALSWASMSQPRSRWRWPNGLLGYACEWRADVAAARRFGAGLGPERYTEVRYEDLVAAPRDELGRICHFLGLQFEPAMLEYWRRIPRGRPLPNHPRLLEPPKPDVRDWRLELGPAVAERLEAIAGDVLAASGYERAHPSPGPAARAAAAAAIAAFRARRGSWQAAAWLWRRSPFWRFRPV